MFNQAQTTASMVTCDRPFNEVEQQLGELNGACLAIRNSIDELTQRLAPVITPRIAKPVAENAGPQVKLCALASQVRDHVEMLRQSFGAIEELKATIQI